MMNYVLRRHSDDLLSIERDAHLYLDPDMDIELLDDYAWSEQSIIDFAARDGNRHCIYGYFGDSQCNELEGYIAFTIHEDIGSYFVDKLESIRDNRETERLRYMMKWLLGKAKTGRVTTLTSEAEAPKIQVLASLGFKSELRKNAFGKKNEDGILWMLTQK